MNESKAATKSDPAAAATFYILSILLFPVSLLGYLITMIGMFIFGRGSGVSKTAQALLFARYIQHILGVRQDAASYRLSPDVRGLADRGRRRAACLFNGEPGLVRVPAGNFLDRDFLGNRSPYSPLASSEEKQKKPPGSDAQKTRS
jgi:hypothetical protein